MKTMKCNFLCSKMCITFYLSSVCACLNVCHGVPEVLREQLVEFSPSKHGTQEPILVYQAWCKPPYLLSLH